VAACKYIHKLKTSSPTILAVSVYYHAMQTMLPVPIILCLPTEFLPHT